VLLSLHLNKLNFPELLLMHVFLSHRVHWLDQEWRIFTPYGLRFTSQVTSNIYPIWSKIYFTSYQQYLPHIFSDLLHKLPAIFTPYYLRFTSQVTSIIYPIWSQIYFTSYQQSLPHMVSDLLHKLPAIFTPYGLRFTSQVPKIGRASCRERVFQPV
jgi:hypothetical protein